MVAEGSFKHIVVHASEDDEVIEAGVVSAAQAEDDEVIETAPQEAPATQTDSPHEARRKPVSEAKQALEDLETEPRSATQRIVIVCAVILIIAAVAYYFLVMR